jgi:hypothetical protein
LSKKIHKEFHFYLCVISFTSCPAFIQVSITGMHVGGEEKIFAGMVGEEGTCIVAFRCRVATISRDQT